jgi:hypothetical protein
LLHPDFEGKYAGIQKDLTKCIDVYYKGNKTYDSYLFKPIFNTKVSELVKEL